MEVLSFVIILGENYFRIDTFKKKFLRNSVLAETGVMGAKWDKK